MINPTLTTIIVWDGPYANKRRQEIYPPYKMQRKEKQESVRASFDLMKQVFIHCPVTQIEIPGWEADDVIATFARRFMDNVIIDTNDSDYWQLQNGQIRIPILEKKLKHRPEHTCMLKALVGDPSDNIPGWRGFGPKSLEAMAEHYDIMDDCLRNEDYDTWSQLPWPKRVIPDYGTFFQCCQFYRLVQMMDVPEKDFDGHVIIGKSRPAEAEAIFHPLHI